LPLSIAMSIPLAIIGAMLALMVRGFDNNIFTQIGLVLLVGLAAKNAILIVEFAKEARDMARACARPPSRRASRGSARS
jgi:multidrug efflux pump subunit AcrB